MMTTALGCRSAGLFRQSSSALLDMQIADQRFDRREVALHQRGFSLLHSVQRRDSVLLPAVVGSRTPSLLFCGLPLRRPFATAANSEAEQAQSKPAASARPDITRLRKRVTRSRRLLLSAAFLVSCTIGMLRFTWLWEPEEKRSGQGAPALPRDTFRVKFVPVGAATDVDSSFGRTDYLCVEEIGAGGHPVFVIADSWPVIQADRSRSEIEECADASDCRLVIVYRPGCGQSALPEGDEKTLAGWAATVEQLADRMYGSEQAFSVIGCGRVESWYALACAAGIRSSRLSSVHLLGEPQAIASLGEDTAFNRWMAKLVYKFWRRRLFNDPEDGILQFIGRASGEEAALLNEHKDIVEILLKQGLYEGVEGVVANMQMVYWTPHGFDAWSTAGAPIHYWARVGHVENGIPEHVLVHPTARSSSLGILAEDLGDVLAAIKSNNRAG